MSAHKNMYAFLKVFDWILEHPNRRSFHNLAPSQAQVDERNFIFKGALNMLTRHISINLKNSTPLPEWLNRHFSGFKVCIDSEFARTLDCHYSGIMVLCLQMFIYWHLWKFTPRCEKFELLGFLYINRCNRQTLESKHSTFMYKNHYEVYFTTELNTIYCCIDQFCQKQSLLWFKAFILQQKCKKICSISSSMHIHSV